jgi:hypothetical protein
MPSSPLDQLEATGKHENRPRRGAGRRRARPLDLANYLRARGDELAEAWTSEIVARELGQGTQFDRIVGRFMARLTGMLPWLLGPHSVHVQPLWDRTAELFGMMAAKRGLAAGEVIEEFQILRDLLIRTLFRDPPREGPLSLRDILRLNRIVDSGVTHASVGHTDALFFQYLEDQDHPIRMPPEEIMREADRQLALVEEELAQVVQVTPVETGEDLAH